MTIQPRLRSKTERAIKEPVRAATTASVTVQGLQTIDGVALAAGDRVLVKDQAATAENGIYYAGTGVWERAADWGTSDRFYNVTVEAGTQVFVAEGDANDGTGWYVATATVINSSTIQTTFAPIVGAELVALATAIAVSSANVGIGRASPVYRLDVLGAAGTTILRVSDGTYGTFGVSFSPTYGVECGSITGSRVSFKANNVVGLIIETTGQPVFLHAPKLPSYPVAGVPSASTLGAGSLIHVSNETGGAVVAFSDGTTWRRVTDRNVVS